MKRAILTAFALFFGSALLPGVALAQTELSPGKKDIPESPGFGIKVLEGFEV